MMIIIITMIMTFHSFIHSFTGRRPVKNNAVFDYSFCRRYRISGGIGAVLDWWPIKAYRPCPNFIERGGMYSRSGQALDEIAFGRDSKFKQK